MYEQIAKVSYVRWDKSSKSKTSLESMKTESSKFSSYRFNQRKKWGGTCIKADVDTGPMQGRARYQLVPEWQLNLVWINLFDVMILMWFPCGLEIPSNLLMCCNVFFFTPRYHAALTAALQLALVQSQVKVVNVQRLGLGNKVKGWGLGSTRQRLEFR